MFNNACCSSKKAIINTRGLEGDPDILEVDKVTYLRTEAADALTEFWEAVDATVCQTRSLILTEDFYLRQ